eukprot:6149212-Amphidinium_carterae.1
MSEKQQLKANCTQTVDVSRSTSCLNTKCGTLDSLEEGLESSTCFGFSSICRCVEVHSNMARRPHDSDTNATNAPG